MTIKNKTLSICMPALNESKNIEKSVKEVYFAAKEILDDFEIIVVNDGSTDNTAEIVQNLIAQFGNKIKLIQKDMNEGIGPAFISALRMARFDFITGFPSDNAFPIDGLKKIFECTGETSVILGYRENLGSRPPLRLFLSRTVTLYVSFLTGKKLTDAQGVVVMPTYLCKQFHMRLAKYNFQMQILSFILNKSVDYKEIPIPYSIKADADSGMIRVTVLFDVIFSSLQLLYLKLMGKL